MCDVNTGNLAHAFGNRSARPRGWHAGAGRPSRGKKPWIRAAMMIHNARKEGTRLRRTRTFSHGGGVPCTRIGFRGTCLVPIMRMPESLDRPNMHVCTCGYGRGACARVRRGEPSLSFFIEAPSGTTGFILQVLCTRFPPSRLAVCRLTHLHGVLILIPKRRFGAYIDTTSLSHHRGRPISILSPAQGRSGYSCLREHSRLEKLTKVGRSEFLMMRSSMSRDTCMATYIHPSSRCCQQHRSVSSLTGIRISA